MCVVNSRSYAYAAATGFSLRCARFTRVSEGKCADRVRDQVRVYYLCVDVSVGQGQFYWVTSPEHTHHHKQRQRHK